MQRALRPGPNARKLRVGDHGRANDLRGSGPANATQLEPLSRTSGPLGAAMLTRPAVSIRHARITVARPLPRFPIDLLRAKRAARARRMARVRSKRAEASGTLSAALRIGLRKAQAAVALPIVRRHGRRRPRVSRSHRPATREQHHHHRSSHAPTLPERLAEMLRARPELPVRGPQLVFGWARATGLTPRRRAAWRPASAAR
jgi:hypothetical protein